MCKSLGKKKDVLPGTYQIIRTTKGTQLNIYGFGFGYQYNARWENINSTWRKIRDNRGIFSVESFWEKDKEFVRKDKLPFKIGVLYNANDEFAILTTEPNPLVKEVHGRMPLCLSPRGEEQFLHGEDTVEQLSCGLFVINNPNLVTA